MKLYYRFYGKYVSELVEIIYRDIHSTDAKLSAFKLSKPVSLKMGTFEPENAKRLDEYTAGLVRHI